MRHKFPIPLFIFASLLLTSLHTNAQPTPEILYDSQDAWLCRPGRSDLCSKDNVVTQLSVDGSKTIQTYRPKVDAPIDCFYVYPTISQDPNPHSSLTAGVGEQRAVSQQFAPFASVCRPFAPMYRQVTLAGLRAVIGGNAKGVNAELPIEDIRAAWRHYLANDNKGRGVVLIGHSQGSRMLVELLKRDIDSKPAQKLLISAMLLGSNILVPSGQTSGGTLPNLTPCNSFNDTSCVVAYTTFRETSPPPNNARFGRSNSANTEVVCTDPAKLSGLPLKSMLVRESNLLGQSALNGDWAQVFEAVDTPFVDMPGLLQTSCVKDGFFHYLSMNINSKMQGKRPSNIPGDIVVNGHPYDDWGLHLVDVNLAMGNLIELARLQGLSWKAKNP